VPGDEVAEAGTDGEEDEGEGEDVVDQAKMSEPKIEGEQIKLDW